VRWRCKRKKIFWGKQEKHQEEDLGRRQSPLVYSCYQVGGRDSASPEQTTMILQQQELSCFCCHGGGRDPVAPSKGQGLDGTHLHQPYGKVGRKTLDGKEDDAAEEELV
jgi:hypothetical protein